MTEATFAEHIIHEEDPPFSGKPLLPFSAPKRPGWAFSEISLVSIPPT
jgi:hypothetical protein